MSDDLKVIRSAKKSTRTYPDCIQLIINNSKTCTAGGLYGFSTVPGKYDTVYQSAIGVDPW